MRLSPFSFSSDEPFSTPDDEVDLEDFSPVSNVSYSQVYSFMELI